MGVFGRIALVVEIVEQADDAPGVDLGGVGDPEPARIRAHGLLDRAAVLAQRVRLRELEQQGLPLGPRDLRHDRPAGGRERRPPAFLPFFY